MQKWEYCVVTGVSARRHAGLFVMDKSQIQRFTCEGLKEMMKLDNIHFGQAVAELGLDGWEMVGMGTAHAGALHCIYFKRPYPALVSHKMHHKRHKQNHRSENCHRTPTQETG